ncbi:MAG: DUF134 domain-containing protein [Nitrososphaeria archaeon]
MPKPIITSSVPIAERFDPMPAGEAEPVYLDLAEIEALRLIELEKLSFEEAGVKMRVSRNTVWRVIENAREKLARALVENRGILIVKEETLPNQQK